MALGRLGQFDVGRTPIWWLTWFAVGATSLLACGDQPGGNTFDHTPAPSRPSGHGLVRIVIHDAPVDEVDEVWVSFDQVSVHHNDLGWFVVSDEERSVDLMALRDGVVSELGLAELPVGQFSQIRLHLSDSWVVADGERWDLRVPSGEQSGVKLVERFSVEDCAVLTISLDWDLDAHLIHNDGQGYILPPTIHVDATLDPVGGSPPIAFWPLDGGTAVDASGNGHDGAVAEAGVSVTTDRHGNDAGALRFTTGHVEVPDHDALDGFDEFAICLWISSEDTDIGTFLAKDYQGDGNEVTDSYNFELATTTGIPGIYVGIDGDSAEFRYTNATTPVASSPDWSHLCAVYDGSSLRLYRDGVLEGDTALVGQIRSTAQPLWFGKCGGDSRCDTSGRSFQGSLDDIRMWDRALLECEVEQDFHRIP